MMDEGEAVLVDELTEAQERIAELERTLTTKDRLIVEAIARLEVLQPGVERLERQVATLRAALALYANAANWHDLRNTEGAWFTGEYAWTGEACPPWKPARAALDATDGNAQP